MKSYLPCILFITMVSSIALGQKDIVLSDELAANSKRLKVKMGTQWMGKIWQFRFGEYAVTDSKNGWQTESYNSNVWGSKVKFKSQHKFSFKLASKGVMAATVDAANEVKMDLEQEIGILPFVAVGENRLLLESANFSAFIQTDVDTANTWLLLMRVTRGYNAQDSQQYYLSDGERVLHIIPVTSNKKGQDKRSIPAMGYEIHEAGRALAAVQYYGGGMLGLNKNVVWLRNDLDKELRLILAAAMTAILQVSVDMQVDDL